MLKENKKIYFIGIGGIGVSALAQYFLEKGNFVIGSDLNYSEILKKMEKQGAKIIIGKQKAINLPKDLDMVIHSPAVKSDNPELKQAIKNKKSNPNLKILTYPQALGELTKNHFTIAISGTHGKSTTTSMLSLILIKAKLDPTVIVGTKLKEFGNSNFRMGKSKYLIIEACEYEESFLNYKSDIAVITNIEEDHLDYFKNLNHILKAFKKFIANLSKNGILAINKDDKNISKILNEKYKIKKFSIKQKKDVEKLKKTLKVPGEYNVYNALSALAVARILKIPDKISFNALSEYKGCWRRFDICEIKKGKRKFKIINDYAHHPTEVKALLSGAREKFPKNKIWAIFQPHQLQRTYYFFNDFVKVFDDADEIVITKIYNPTGRGDSKIAKKVSSEKLAESLRQRGKKARYAINFQKIIQIIETETKPNDIILLIGAGDIYNLNSQFNAY
ncbi:MAG: UDP-N-acetylmuramate--L-alanine ligase [Patescibacteria group bacterium]|nr:UDP-N-acetylmuramate--L-alanine ligase [Patescibacteria group bacterium]